MKPILSFDNSAMNQIVRDSSPHSILSAIAEGYVSRVPMMAFEETFATSKKVRRVELISAFRRLLASGTCLLPPHVILEFHVKAHHAAQESFDWRKVLVRAKPVEEEIMHGELADDESLVKEQADQQQMLIKEYETVFPPSSLRFNSFAEWIEVSKKPNGSLWNTTRILYEGAFRFNDAMIKTEPLTQPPTEEVLSKFLDACPPVRAAVYAIELSHYDRSFRNENQISYKGGRNDQMMSIYLPYCDVFLTDDTHQHRGFVEVAKAANIPVQVTHYRDFLGGHLVSV